MLNALPCDDTGHREYITAQNRVIPDIVSMFVDQIMYDHHIVVYKLRYILIIFNLLRYVVVFYLCIVWYRAESVMVYTNITASLHEGVTRKSIVSIAITAQAMIHSVLHASTINNYGEFNF